MIAYGRRWRLWPLMISLVFFAAATGSTTEASGVNSMITGGLTSQPIGHYEFCRANPRECSIRPDVLAPLVMSEALMRQIRHINQSVNETVSAMSDFDIHGRDEVWSYPVEGFGDCEDYVLEKRRLLMNNGISLADLLITVVRKPDGEGHAVLTVRTDRGDFILDNLTDEIRLWYKTGYHYLKRQSSSHTGRWVTLREDQNMLVGAVQ